MLNWKLMADPYPELGDIVIIAKDGAEDDCNKWRLGQFFQSDDGTKYGVLVNFSEEGEIVLKVFTLYPC